MMLSEVERAYKEGLEELLFLAPVYGALARAMGRPVWDTEQPTAYVTYSQEEGRVLFAFNPEFILTMDAEGVAAVIAHETYHVALHHLDDLGSPLYPNQAALTKAHECIINDTVEGTLELPLPDFVLRGMALVQRDCSQLSTMEAYKLFCDEQEKQEQNSDSSAGDGEAQEGDGQGTGNSSSDSVDGACGGMRVPEGAEDAMKQAVDAVFSETADDLGMTEDELDSKITAMPAGDFSPMGPDTTVEQQLSRERMNWRSLLAEINPKVLEAGRPRKKYKNNWTTYNRRMGAVYPKVILPKTQAIKPKKDDAGDQLPVLVIALDQSGSIPASLRSVLQGMLSEIPEDLIKAYPCTWGSNLVPFVPGGRVAGSNATNINVVIDYVEKVKKESGVEPYVLIISDAEFATRHAKPGRKWFWMGVDRSSVRTFKQARYGRGGQASADEQVYCVDDFRV